jgi:ribosome hibernation promoting factor
MQIDVTFRRMEASQSIKTYLDDKLSRMKKFIAKPSHARVVLTSERFRNKADVTLTLHNGLFIKGVDTSEDMYFSIDQALSRIEKQLRKYKEKIHSHKPLTHPSKKFMSHTIEPMDDYDDYPESAALEVEEIKNEKVEDDSNDITHKIVKTNEYVAEPLNLESALMHIELQNKQFLVFTNSVTNEINILYRRDDGKFGLIEYHKQ